MNLVAYILCGVPGSGKSTWASQKLNNDTVYCSSDEYIEKYAKEKNKTYSEVFAEYIQISVSKMIDDVHYADEHHMNIIWDQTNTSTKARAKKLKMIPTYRKVAVVFPTPEKDELKRRLESRPGKHIPDNVIKQMIEGFSMPTQEEGFDEIIIL